MNLNFNEPLLKYHKFAISKGQIVEYEKALASNSSKSLSNSSKQSNISSVNNTSSSKLNNSQPITTVLKQGYLLKKSNAMFKQKQTRYFVFTSDLKLTWFLKVLYYE